MSLFVSRTFEANRFGPPAYRLYRLGWLVLDWLYPPFCGGCGKPYTRWCTHCSQQVRKIQDPVCGRCGGAIAHPGYCRECQTNPPPYTAVNSYAYYEEPLRNAIHQLKYKGNISLGERLARPMIELLKGTGWQVDMVVPVPNSLARKRLRGYNQASLLAIPIALCLGIAFRPGAMVRVRDTRSQVGLSAVDRKQNVAGAFLAAKELVSQRSVLVVDDIRTSGATMEACAATLFDQGARQVYGLTLARAGLENL